MNDLTGLQPSKQKPPEAGRLSRGQAHGGGQFSGKTREPSGQSRPNTTPIPGPKGAKGGEFHCEEATSQKATPAV